MRDILGFERLQDLAQSLILFHSRHKKVTFSGFWRVYNVLQCVNFSIHVPGIKTKYEYTFR